VAALFIDLDDFKTVNDALGHTAGDTLLIAAADRLATHLRPGDTAARLGGDEFAVLVEDATDHATITAVAQRLITALTAPYTIDATTVSITVSIGIAARDTTGSAQLLIRDADIAMYDAKAHGKGRHAWFTPPMRIQALHRWQLRTDLTTAVADNQLFVEYQPIIELATGRIAGAEALIRWHHPTRGVIPPGEFIPIAEQTGLITDIGDWILHAATTHAATWQPPAHPSYISVNLSPVQLRDHTLLTRVQHALTTAGLPPAALMLELTESTLMHDIDQARATLAELKHLGIRIAIDDFGTGYSSLAYLHQLPVDILKIDRSFVHELNTPAHTHTLAHDIIALAHALNLTTIAEGIETPQQRNHLQTIGCTHGQGYHLGRPMPQHHLAERRDRRIGSLAYR
jgi:diguanylate cyclase (GGDEF)-like protein